MKKQGRELPEGWRWGTIGDPNVATVIMGQSPPGNTYNSEGRGFPFFQGKADFGEVFPIERVWCTAPKKIAEPGDILLSVRAPVGPTNIATRRCCIGRGLAAIRGRRLALTPYLYYWFKHIETWLSAQGEGSTFTAIGKDIIERLEIPLPPLPVQERIVEILRKADEIRRKRKVALELSNKILPALFLEMFGDPAKNPKGFEKTTIGEITSMVTSGYTPRGGAINYVQDGPLLIRSQNIRMLSLDLSECAHIPESIFNEMARVHVQPGDVLMNITGKGTAGRVTWVDNNELRAAVNQHVCIIRCKKDKILAPFLAIMLSTPYYQSIIEMAPGSTQTGFNHSRVRGLEVIVPPMPMQRMFVAQVATLREVTQKLNVALQSIEQSFSTLMSLAFTGELTAEWEAANSEWIEQRKEFYERLPRLVILAFLVEKAKRICHIRAEVLITALMKYLFLLQMEGSNQYRLYHFIPYHYGPFAKEVYTDLQGLAEEGFVAIDNETEEEKTRIILKKLEEAEQEVADLPDEFKQDIATIIESYGELDHRSLLQTVYEKYPEYAKKSRLKRRME